MKKLTVQQLIEMLLRGEIKGGTFVGLDTITDVKLTGGKSNPMQGRVKKVVVGSNLMSFSNQNGSAYANKVRRHLEKEGKNPDSFELKPRAWGERVPNTPIVKHTKKGAIEPTYYLEVIFLSTGKVSYLLDGRPIRKDLIEGLPTSREEGKQGGLSEDNKVIIRTYAIESISRITINKETYFIEG